MNTNYQSLKKAFSCALGIILIVPFIQAQTLSDTEITNAITGELLLHEEVPAYKLDVETDNGIVTLSGKTTNLLAKEMAKKVAMAIKGVKGVVNLIEVDAPAIDDLTLQQNVSDALLFDPATEAFKINVEAEDGRIILSGTVNSWQEKQLAAKVSKGVKGVEKITNNITINYKTNRNDLEVEEEVESLLANDVRIDHALIDVSVDNSVVTLSGTVGSATEKEQAKYKAWVTGVKNVKTEQLEVEKWARDKNMRKNKYLPKEDEEIKQAVEDVLLYDPRVFSFNPDVTVNNAVVTLSGVVDNLKAKRAAGSDAKNVVGVLAVRNLLKVRPVEIPSDQMLEERVETALLENPYIDRFDLEVIAYDGEIFLSGNVDNYFQKYLADDIASTVKGVTRINNSISVDYEADYNQLSDNYYYQGWNTVYPGPYISLWPDNEPMNDAEIERNIESQLWWSPFVNEYEVNVEVENGLATLTGVVETYEEKSAAAKNALEGGAVAVDNKLEVELAPDDQ